MHHCCMEKLLQAGHKSLVLLLSHWCLEENTSQEGEFVFSKLNLKDLVQPKQFCDSVGTVLAGGSRPSTSYAEKDIRNNSYLWKFCVCPHLPGFQSLLPSTRAILPGSVKQQSSTRFINKVSSTMSDRKKIHAITAAACNPLALPWGHIKNMVHHLSAGPRSKARPMIVPNYHLP